MKTEISYSEAYNKLEELVTRLEDGNIPLEQLSATVEQAHELIAICEAKLRSTETAIKGLVS